MVSEESLNKHKKEKQTGQIESLHLFRSRLKTVINETELSKNNIHLTALILRHLHTHLSHTNLSENDTDVATYLPRWGWQLRKFEHGMFSGVGESYNERTSCVCRLVSDVCWLKHISFSPAYVKMPPFPRELDFLAILLGGTTPSN